MLVFTTNPVSLRKLLEDVEVGKIQLPEFQRRWVWDDYRIRALLASISRGFPVGAIMTLDAGGDTRFKARPVEGANSEVANAIDLFLLDGQQRITSLYQALRYPGPVDTHDSRGGRIRRWYYIDMLKAMDPVSDREDAIVSVPENKRVTRDFGRETALDLSTPELEYRNHMIPTEHLLQPMNWMFAYQGYWQQAGTHPHENLIDFSDRFNKNILEVFGGYLLPVIGLTRETPKEAVCTVFEKVNTGGVTLTVFELVTATFAADDFDLRDDWDQRRQRLHTDFAVLRGIQGEQFLQAVALLATQQRRREKEERGEPAKQLPSIGCQKRDILELKLNEYRDWSDKVADGFKQAAKFLHRQFVFKQWDVPYNTQLVPLAALFVELGNELEPAIATQRLERWFWSGIFSEAYGGGVETQYALDLDQVASYVRTGVEPRLITEASFNPERLISLRTRNSAAYKGLYALQMKSGAVDWRTGDPLTLSTYHDQAIDIHHIFPVAWCQKREAPIPRSLYDSIINKTPIDASTNRIIGSAAPSRYLGRLEKDNPKDNLRSVLQRHWLDYDLLEGDQFAECFVARGEAMLNLIFEAMGRANPGGEEVFRNTLIRAGVVPEEPEPTAPLEIEGFDDPEPDYDEIGSAAYEDGGAT